jgi:hypothetical protein
VRYGECQPIRRGFGDSIRPDGARSAGAVLNNNTRAKGIRKGRREKPTNSICQTARRKARDQANGLAVRPSLGARLGCEGKQGWGGQENTTLHDLKAPTAQRWGSTAVAGAKSTY